MKSYTSRGCTCHILHMSHILLFLLVEKPLQVLFNDFIIEVVIRATALRQRSYTHDGVHMDDFNIFTIDSLSATRVKEKS